MKSIPIIFLLSLMIMQVLGGRSFLFKKENETEGNSTVAIPISADPINSAASLDNQIVNNGNETLLGINATNSARMNSFQPMIQLPADSITQAPIADASVNLVPIGIQPTIATPVASSNIGQIPSTIQPLMVNQPIDTSSILQIPNQTQPAIVMPSSSQPTISTPIVENTIQVPVNSASVTQVPVNSETVTQVPINQPNIAQIPISLPSIAQIPVGTAPIEQVPINQPSIIQMPIHSESIAQVPVDTSAISQVPINSASIAQVPINSASIAQVPLTSNMVIQTPTVLNTNSLNLDKMSGLLSPTKTQIQVTQIPSNAFNWAPTSMMANDVGVSAEGDIYVAGLDGKLYTYNFATASYTRVIADPDLDNITRVSVDGDGTPYVITNCGASYYLSCDNKWIQLPGCASDIGAGSCGQIWKTGCDQRQDGFGIWKLFCSGEEKKCKRYRQFNSYSTCNQLHTKRECYWYRVSGSGVRLDVFSDGKPAIVQSNGAAIKYDGNEWKMITQFPASDITVSNEGMVIISGANSGLYFIPTKPTQTRDDFFDERYGFSLFAPESVMQQTVEEPLDARTRYIDVGCTMALSSGPYSQPTIIPCITQYQPIVALTQKFNYN